MSDKTVDGYNNGADFWHDNAASYGFDEALTISRDYLDMNLKREHSDYERKFCRELFMAMYEVVANKFDPTKIVYPYDFEKANERMETSYYHINRGINEDCARGIDKALNDAQYAYNYCNTETAAMTVLLDFGFNRVCTVLAHHIHQHASDGRYSSANKEWAQGFKLPEKSFYYLSSHACLIDSFTEHVRRLYDLLGAERFALPGKVESGAFVQGYQILRSIVIDDNQGYVIAQNPNAVSPWVCWQYYIRDDGPSYNWGIYGEEHDAVDAFNARVFVAYNNLPDGE